jgi:hypothetical protein
MGQRYTATIKADWSVITLTAEDGKGAFDMATAGPSCRTRAGGVVFLTRGSTAEYLPA